MFSLMLGFFSSLGGWGVVNECGGFVIGFRIGFSEWGGDLGGVRSDGRGGR